MDTLRRKCVSCGTPTPVNEDCVMCGVPVSGAIMDKVTHTLYKNGKVVGHIGPDSGGIITREEYNLRQAEFHNAIERAGRRPPVLDDSNITMPVGDEAFLMFDTKESAMLAVERQINENLQRRNTELLLQVDRLGDGLYVWSVVAFIVGLVIGYAL